MYKPLGQFNVGYCDFSYFIPHESSTLDPNKHLVGGIFYPADKTAKKAKAQEVKWIPAYGYAHGFAHFVLGLAAYSLMGIWQRLVKTMLRSIMASFSYALGHSTSIPAHKGVDLCVESSLPFVLLSHGVGGQRMVQSCLACELASQGFFVVALEHADGTASAVQMATKEGHSWRYFEIHNDEKRRRQILFRLQEMKSAFRLFTAANEGKAPGELSFQDAPERFKEALHDKLDLGCAVTVGHSFGGGPSAALPMEENSPACLGIGLDAYWPPLPADHSVFSSAQRPAALLLIGSQTWNDATQKSFIKTDAEREAKAVKAYSRSHQTYASSFFSKQSPGRLDGRSIYGPVDEVELGGAGCVSVVMKGIGHASFTDADLLFGAYTAKLTPWGQPKDAKKPALIIQHMNEIILTFLRLHLPLSDEQLARIQTSKPQSSRGTASPLPHSQSGGSDWELVEKDVKVESPARAASTGAGTPSDNPSNGAEGGEKNAAAEVLGKAIERQVDTDNQGSAEDDQGPSLKLPESREVSGTEQTLSRACRPVSLEEQGLYEAILGKDGVYAIKITP